MTDITIVGKPKKKYRVYIKEINTKTQKHIHCKSFMIYDFKGKTNINTIKEKLRGIK